MPVFQDRVVIRSRPVNTRVMIIGKRLFCSVVTWVTNSGSLNHLLPACSVNAETLAYSSFKAHINKTKPVTLPFCKYLMSSISGVIATTIADMRMLAVTCLPVLPSFCLCNNCGPTERILLKFRIK